MQLGRHFLWVILLAELAGCQNPMQSLALKNLEAETQGLAAAIDKDRSAESALAKTSEVSKTTEVFRTPAPATNALQLAAYQDKEKPKKEPKVILTIPEDLPGSDFRGFELPKDEAELEKYIKKIYPPLDPLEADLILAPGPEGRPMTLGDLQLLATQYNHSIKAAEQAWVVAFAARHQFPGRP